MAQVGSEQVAGQVISVGQVAVVSQGDPVRAVHIKRLGLGRARTAGGWVAHMANTHVTRQTTHVPGVKHIPHQPVILPEIESVVLKGHNSRRILATVLKNGQRIVKQLINVGSTDNTDNATYGWATLRVLELNVIGMQTWVSRLRFR